MARTITIRPCRRKGCQKTPHALGLCWAHYQRQRRAKKKAS